MTVYREAEVKFTAIWPADVVVTPTLPSPCSLML